MKFIIFSIVIEFLLFFNYNIEALSNGVVQTTLFKTAHMAAKEKKCLGENYDGDVSFKHKIVSSCFAGGYIEEVHVLPCKEGLCDQPKAKVSFKCDTTKPHTRCL